MELLNLVYCLAMLLEFSAFVYLRYKAPSLVRPFRVPVPAWGAALLLLPATSLLFTILAMPLLRVDTEVGIYFQYSAMRLRRCSDLLTQIELVCCRSYDADVGW